MQELYVRLSAIANSIAAAVVLIGPIQAQSLSTGDKPVWAQVQSEPANERPYKMEWVYRIRYGHQDEWWKIFQKYQIAILDREKQLGYVTDYIVDEPELHTSEDARWDFRVVITYRNINSLGHGREVIRELFPDKATLTREEQQRWELTINHWDLPIYDVDPHTVKVEN